MICNLAESNNKKSIMENFKLIRFYLEHSINLEMIRNISIEILENEEWETSFFSHEKTIVDFYNKNKDKF